MNHCRDCSKKGRVWRCSLCCWRSHRQVTYVPQIGFHSLPQTSTDYSPDSWLTSDRTAITGSSCDTSGLTLQIQKSLTLMDHTHTHWCTHTETHTHSMISCWAATGVFVRIDFHSLFRIPLALLTYRAHLSDSGLFFLDLNLALVFVRCVFGTAREKPDCWPLPSSPEL